MTITRLVNVLALEDIPHQFAPEARGKRAIFEHNGVKRTLFEHESTGASLEYVTNSGICETTPGVNSYSGYIDLDVRPQHRYSRISWRKIGKLSHIFSGFLRPETTLRKLRSHCGWMVDQVRDFGATFYFILNMNASRIMAHSNLIEANTDPRDLLQAATRWLVFFKVGGDIRLEHSFEFNYWPLLELGPCNVTANLTSQVNPYSFNEVSNLLFLSQPLGVGFSYASEDVGGFNDSRLWNSKRVRG